jgi:hypothetical protein
MVAIKNLITRVTTILIVFVVITSIIYGFGRLFHFFPPIKAIIQHIQIKKIEKASGTKSLVYSVSLDQLSDIYAEKDYENWEADTRRDALKSFVDNKLQNTPEYADCLFRYTDYLLWNERENFRSSILDCRNRYLKLFITNSLNDNSKRNLIQAILASPKKTTKDEIALALNALRVSNSIKIQNQTDIRYKILIHTSLGTDYTDDYSNWLKAQTNFEIALKMSEGKDYLFENTMAKLLLANLFIHLQDFEKALSTLDQCDINMLKEIKFRFMYRKLKYEALVGIGDIVGAQKESKIIETLNYENNPNIQIITYSNNANKHIEKGNRIRSKYYLYKLNDLLKEYYPNDNLKTFTYLCLATRYYIKFDPPKVKECIVLAKSYANFDFPNYTDILKSEAANAKSTGNNKIYFDKNAEIFEFTKKNIQKRFQFLTEYQRSKYWNSNEKVIWDLYEASYRIKNNPIIGTFCYDAALFSKGILLSSSIEFSRIVNESGDKKAIDDYKHLQYIKSQVNTDYDRKLNTDSLNSNAEKLERMLLVKHGDYIKNMLIKWEDVQSNLKPNEVAIEFIDFNNGKDSIMYAALIINKNWNSPKFIPLFEQKQLSKFINKSPNKIYSKKYGIQISKLIWEPLLPYITKNIKVYFSPTNLLYKIAIESLPLSDTKLISDRNEIVRVSSTRVLCLKKANDSIQSSALYGGINYKLTDKQLISESRAYGSKYKMQIRGEQFNLGTGISWQNLPQTKKEVVYIDSLLSKKSKLKPKLYTGNKGNEESFKYLSGRKTNLIHIASHGFFLPIERAKQLPFFNIDDSKSISENALDRSGLIFAGANVAWSGSKVPEGIEDGILTAKEISILDFRNTNLLVLSACDTGLGEITSDGVFGLQRAFKQAGVKTIVMSLWKVNDSATEIFMSNFYYNLLNGKNKRQSFTGAQKSLRCNKKYNNPYYWAAFVMVD